MLTKDDLIIGYVRTKEIRHGTFFIPSATYAVTEVIQVNGVTCYVTNVAHKVFPDRTFLPLVVTENMAMRFRKFKKSQP